jgi:hypothetical protein
MHLIFALVAASFLVGFGYFALWSSSQPATPRGVASFGRVLAIILFVVAGLTLVSPVAARHFHRGNFQASCMMDRTHFRGHPGFMGHFQRPWMNGMQMRGDKNCPAGMAPQEKPENPAPAAK